MRIADLLKRTISGIVYVLLILWALLSDQLNAYYLVFSVLAFIGVFEYSRLVKNNATRPLRNILDSAAAVYLFWFVSLYRINPSMLSFILFAPYLFYIMYVIIRSIYTEKDGLPNSIGKTIFGQLYVGGSLSMANMLVMNSVGSHSSRILLLMIFVCIWANDTGAYIVGSSMGKHRLFPSISPKKSWEGFAGGVVFSMITAMNFGIFNLVPTEVYSYPSLALIGLLVAVSATWGDLFESSIKRNAGVKDSGNIIPGHGGILDRIDSLLFALPIGVLFIYIVFENYIIG